MVGVITTTLMHYPVTSLLDAFLFVIKGYRLDSMRYSEARLAWSVSKRVTVHLVISALAAPFTLLMILALLSGRRNAR